MTGLKQQLREKERNEVQWKIAHLTYESSWERGEGPQNQGKKEKGIGFFQKSILLFWGYGEGWFGKGWPCKHENLSLVKSRRQSGLKSCCKAGLAAQDCVFSTGGWGILRIMGPNQPGLQQGSPVWETKAPASLWPDCSRAPSSMCKIWILSTMAAAAWNLGGFH